MDRHMDHGDRSHWIYVCITAQNAGAVFSVARNRQAFLSIDLFPAGGRVSVYPQQRKVSGTSLVLCSDLRDSL